MKTYNISVENSVATIVIKSNIVATFVDNIKPEITDLINKYNHIVFDMKEVEMVDSIGIGFLVATFNSVKKNDGSVTINNLTSELLDLFKSMNLHQHFLLGGQ